MTVKLICKSVYYARSFDEVFQTVEASFLELKIPKIKSKRKEFNKGEISATDSYWGTLLKAKSQRYLSAKISLLTGEEKKVPAGVAPGCVELYLCVSRMEEHYSPTISLFCGYDKENQKDLDAVIAFLVTRLGQPIAIC